MVKFLFFERQCGRCEDQIGGLDEGEILPTRYLSDRDLIQCDACDGCVQSSDRMNNARSQGERRKPL